MALGKFQTQEFVSWQGMTKKNHIGALFAKNTQKAVDFMVELLAYTRNKRSLDSMLSKFPTKEFESDDEYTWDIIASARRNISLVEARNELGEVVTADSGMVGANTAPFYLVFAEDWFGDGEVVVGNLNEIYQFRILGDGRNEGSNTIYKVELMGGNTVGCPAERLLAGEKFSVEFAPVESELSRKAGTIRFSAPISMRNEWSTIRIYHKVPGSANQQKLKVGIPIMNTTESGGCSYKVAESWMHYVEWQFEAQWADYKNHILAFGRSNRNANGEYMNFGKSGSAIRLGDGYFAQQEVANTFYYNVFSLKLIEDALYELSAANMDFGQRKFVLKTGEMGAKKFSKAVAAEVSGWTQIVFDNSSVKAVNKANSPLHSNALSAGFQFVEWMAPNGVTVTVEVDPAYDDRVRNKIRHPEGGVAMSYRYDIIYLGTAQEPNVFKCKIKGNEESRGYQAGLRNPFTNVYNNVNMSYDEDSASIHALATLGICVLDPTRTMSLIPEVLQG